MNYTYFLNLPNHNLRFSWDVHILLTNYTLSNLTRPWNRYHCDANKGHWRISILNSCTFDLYWTIFRMIFLKMFLKIFLTPFWIIFLTIFWTFFSDFLTLWTQFKAVFTQRALDRSTFDLILFKKGFHWIWYIR